VLRTEPALGLLMTSPDSVATWGSLGLIATTLFPDSYCHLWCSAVCLDFGDPRWGISLSARNNRDKTS
jgi:hypothetical protein